jgi:uncharacterized protein
MLTHAATRSASHALGPIRREPFAWVLHDEKPGMRSQAVGLAEATGFEYVEKPLAIRAPWRLLPPQLWLFARHAVPRAAGLVPPWPDLVVACGRNAVLPALFVRRASNGVTVAAQVQDPRIGRDEFDLLVIPQHDRLRGPRIVTTLSAVHLVTGSRLAAAAARFPALEAMPRPRIAVLIGGANRAYRLSLRRLAEIADALAGLLAETGGSLLVTPSRRTGEAGLALLRQRLAGSAAAIWDGSGDNPYYAYLALADAILVTADSVSMISEAAATGKPVHIIELAGGGGKFARFHESMRQAGITRPFRGRLESWSYPVPDDTARAGAALRALVLLRLHTRHRG